METHYDLIALGGGSGGIAVARRAAAHGARSALIEAGKLGGTCVNRGCVPKKLMWHAAGIAHTLQEAKDYGFSSIPVKLDWARHKLSRDAHIKRLNGIYHTNLEDSGVELINGRGRFIDTHTLEVDGKRYTAEHIVIATGGKPQIPEVPGARLGISSDGFFGLFTQPQRVAIAGSGYIAIEFAGMLNALGSEVTLLIRRQHFLNGFDTLIQDQLMAAMQENGINVLCSVQIEGVERDPEGVLTLTTSHDHRLTGFDCLIWAIGRNPATSEINPGAAGITLNGRGFIETDTFQNTSVPGIYAIGDVTGRAALTPVAIAAGRRLADRLFGKLQNSRLDYENIPTVIFSHPPAGSIGLTEDAARTLHGSATRVYQTRFIPLYYGLTRHKTHAAMKLVTVGSDEKIVGCHVIGQGADEMLQGFAVAIRMGACKRDLDDTVAIHPTSAEEMVTLR